MSNIQSSVESSLLMWALSALIVWMGAHVMLGWMRQAQEDLEWDLGRLRQIATGGAAFGTALSVAIPLGLAGEALSFPIGYSPLAAAALWLGTMLLLILLALVPVWREEAASAAGAGVLVGLAMTGLQIAWMLAVGFRPGVQWEKVFIGAAAVVSAAGSGTAMAIAFPYGERARTYSYSWRIAAAGLLGLSFLAGFALVLFAADLPTQLGSVYRHELPGGAISLVGGGLLPILLLLMVMDLESRRRQRRRQWRARRRGETGSTFGGDSMMPGMNMQPSRYRTYGQAAAPVAAPAAAAPPPAATLEATPALTAAAVAAASAAATDAASSAEAQPASPQPSEPGDLAAGESGQAPEAPSPPEGLAAAPEPIAPTTEPPPSR